jgi:hypothetical protein
VIADVIGSAQAGGSRIKRSQTPVAATRKILRGTYRGELWGLPPTGNRVQAEFIDIFRIRDGKLAEHWFHFEFEELRSHQGPESLSRNSVRHRIQVLDAISSSPSDTPRRCEA